MKSLLPTIIVFGISLLMFTVAAVQILLGYTLTGKSGNQRKIYMTDEPAKFWIIVSIPIVIGAAALIWSLLLMFGRGEKR